MKKKFSISWLGSSQVRKQRKYRANAPLHLRHKLVSSNLSKDLRKKVGKRSLAVRKGDNVKVLRGTFKRKTGKVASVDLKRLRITIEGLQRQKKDGTKINVYFNPSKIQILELVEDRFRMGKPKKEISPIVNSQPRENKQIKTPSKENNEVKNAPKKK